MPGAKPLTTSQRTAPRLWWARTLEMDVNMMVAMDVAIAILTARSAGTRRADRMHGHEGADQHAAANAQQAGQKSGGQAQCGQFEDQEGSDSMGGRLRVSANATGPAS